MTTHSGNFLDQYCIRVFPHLGDCNKTSFCSIRFLSYEVPARLPFCFPIVYHTLSFFDSLFLSLAHRCLMMVIFHPGPSVSWCGEALGPPLFLMRHDGKLPRALCCQIVTHCLVVISRQTPACVFSHTRAQTPLIVCINYTVWDHHSDHSCVGHALLSRSLGSSAPYNSYSTVTVRHNST